MDYVHVFVLRKLCFDEDGEFKSQNVAVTFDRVVKAELNEAPMHEKMQ